jgi:hypothetical protein
MAENGLFGVPVLSVRRVCFRLRKRQSLAGKSLLKIKALNCMFMGKMAGFVKEAALEKIHFRQRVNFASSHI